MRPFLPILLLPSAILMGQAPTPMPGLVGTWELTLVDNVLPDGSRVHLYGPHPQGLLVFDGEGHYAIQILREGRPRFAAGDKTKGTPEENRVVVAGSNSHFGRYTVNPPERTITFHIDHAFFPNWEGSVQIRTFTLMGDELRYTVPSPTTGGITTGEVGWNRVN